MKAQVSDEFDLVISWDDFGLSKIIWSACSDCEFEVRVEIGLHRGLNYQEAIRLEFSTTCYASALRDFAGELHDFISGRRDSARYYGSEDMEIRVHCKEGQADAKGQSITACDLRFEMHRSLDLIYCGGRIEMTLGRLDEPKRTIQAIEEVMRVMKMKDGPGV